MSSLNRIKQLVVRAVAAAFLFATVAAGMRAQDTSVTTVQHGEASFDTQVRNAEVVYVEGNDLVLRLEDGKVEHLVVPDSDKFTIDGNEVTVHELKTGTKLTQTITTSTAPRYVTTVRTLSGKIWHVNPHASSVILTLPEGGNRQYTIPNHATFSIDGQKKTVFDLRKGMNIQATIVTDDEHTVLEQSKVVVGQAPAAVETPQEVGLLLFFEPTHPSPLETTWHHVEAPATTLPETGSSLPLIALLGSLAVAGSLGLGAIRKAL